MRRNSDDAVWAQNLASGFWRNVRLSEVYTGSSGDEGDVHSVIHKNKRVWRRESQNAFDLFEGVASRRILISHLNETSPSLKQRFGQFDGITERRVCYSV
jgi:hypothetical protein